MFECDIAVLTLNDKFACLMWEDCFASLRLLISERLGISGALLGLRELDLQIQTNNSTQIIAHRSTNGNVHTFSGQLYSFQSISWSNLNIFGQNGRQYPARANGEKRRILLFSFGTFAIKFHFHWQNLGIKSQKLYQWALINDLDVFQLICSRLKQFTKNLNFYVQKNSVPKLFLCTKNYS